MYACTNQTEDTAYSYTSLAIWMIKLSKHMDIFNSLYRPFGSCHVTGLSSDTSSLNQPMWRWIKNARFSGVKQFRQQKVNMWTYTVSLYHNIVPNCLSHLFLFFLCFQDNTTSTFYSLGVSRRNPNKPIFLYEMHTYYTYRRNVTVFAKYKPGPPQNNVFKIPKVCSEK